MADNVRCRDCGYLAIRHVQTRQLAEVESDIRLSGKFPEREEWIGQTLHRLPIYDTRLMCFRMEEEFAMHRDQQQLDFATLLDIPRNCSNFIEWKHGWTPREHMEMDMLKELKLREDARDAAQLEWQAQQLAKQVDRDEKWREEDRRATRTNTVISFTGLLIAVIVPLIAIAVELVKPDKPQMPPVVNVTAPPPVVVPAPVVNLPPVTPQSQNTTGTSSPK